MQAGDKEILWLPWLGKGQEHLQKQDNLERGHKALFALTFFSSSGLTCKLLTGYRVTLNLSSPRPSPKFLVLDLRVMCTGHENNHSL